MAGRGSPKLKRRPAGEGKPGVPYIPIFPPKPDEGQWFWHYQQREWVATDPYAEADE